MNHRVISLIILLAGALISAINTCAATATARDAGIDNIGMNDLIFRVNDGLVLDNTGFCLKGYVNVSASDYRGHRLFILIEPIVDGSYMEDNVGPCTAIFSFTPNSAQYTGKVRFSIPYSWSGMNMNSQVNNINSFTLKVSVADFSKKEPLVSEKLITIDNSKINIDRDKMIKGNLSEMLGGGDGLGILGGLFGSGNTITHKCAACDGTGLCSRCDGDGFIDPSQCRHCASNPGICRRCKGKGEETSEVEIDSGGLFW